MTEEEGAIRIVPRSNMPWIGMTAPTRALWKQAKDEIRAERLLSEDATDDEILHLVLLRYLLGDKE